MFFKNLELLLIGLWSTKHYIFAWFFKSKFSILNERLTPIHTHTHTHTFLRVYPYANLNICIFRKLVEGIIETRNIDFLFITWNFQILLMIWSHRVVHWNLRSICVCIFTYTIINRFAKFTWFINIQEVPKRMQYKIFFFFPSHQDLHKGSNCYQFLI